MDELQDYQDKDQHYQLVARAIEFIHARQAEQPTLTEIANAVSMSELHLQRVFSKWAGISPKRFLQFLTKQVALDTLKHSDNILDASLSAGLSGTGRLHDLMVSCEAMTPGEIKLAGLGMVIEYALINTPFGEGLLAWTSRGICYLQFVDQQLQILKDDLFAQWPNAQFIENQQQGNKLSEQIFSSSAEKDKLHLLIKGTNFQVKVWEAMLTSMDGQLFSYAQVSKAIGSPKASRAVGSALGKNRIAYLIPCHRVIKNTGVLSHYRWGVTRKATYTGLGKIQK
ncbi:methylated-DNA--[protein]-cysteine S-methyltransferase [Psychromonas sp. KJ10-10]|uniref:methylated-DNA--[protein]-cysteine S-methyltransferase n=1 Tax=Psychromonas sp. KJ10-10 TaxID=3391823 RepID=UPI0039B4BBA7